MHLEQSFPCLRRHLPIQILQLADETKCVSSSLIGCRNPAKAGKSFCEGTDPLSHACPTRAHLSRTWTGEDAPPQERGGPIHLEALCHARYKTPFFPTQSLSRAIRMRWVREHPACATPVRGSLL